MSCLFLSLYLCIHVPNTAVSLLKVIRSLISSVSVGENPKDSEPSSSGGGRSGDGGGGGGGGGRRGGKKDWWSRILKVYIYSCLILSPIEMCPKTNKKSHFSHWPLPIGYHSFPLSVVLCVQGDFPWDEKDFQYLALGAAGVSATLLYLYFRDRGKEITWKDFIHRYLDRGLVSVPSLTLFNKDYVW